METIGSKLKAAREKQKMTPVEVAKAVRIKTEYVEAIDQNEFHKLIAPVYAKGFIKLYAEYVQLNPAPLLRQFGMLESSPESNAPRPETRSKKEISPARSRRRWRARFADLIEAFRKQLPEVKPWKGAALPIEIHRKKWALPVIAALVCFLVVFLFLRHAPASGSGAQAPAACRWVAEPPEPYLNVPVAKTPNSR